MDLELTTIFLISVAALGFIAGTLGGMLGVGGSVIMIPGLVMMLGQDKVPGINQHIYQAAAMIANVAVSVPAALRHHQAKATCPQAIKWLLPSTLVFVLVGVWMSNQFEGSDGATWLGRCMAVLLAYVIFINVRKLIRQWRVNHNTNGTGISGENTNVVPTLSQSESQDSPRSLEPNDAISDGEGFGDAGESDDPDAIDTADRTAHADNALSADTTNDCDSSRATDPSQSTHTPMPDGIPEGHITPMRCVVVGSVMGIIAGLMGVGGGAIAVPLQQLLLKLPLRRCIANSSAVICISAAVGAIYKNASLSQHIVEATGEPYRWQNSIILALLLAPTCFLGGRLGAALTHALPLKWVRGAFIALLCVAAYKMAAIPWDEWLN